MMSRNGNETRKRILEVSLKLLTEGGTSLVRMSDIAKAAGITRQALYLHFPSRSELLLAVTKYIDEVKESDARLVASRTATTGAERLRAFVSSWIDYIPEIYPVVRPLMAMLDTDEVAASVWEKRMSDMREGCEAAIRMLWEEGALSSRYDVQTGTDFLWAMLSVRNWELLTQQSDWSQAAYKQHMLQACDALFLA